MISPSSPIMDSELGKVQVSCLPVKVPDSLTVCDSPHFPPKFLALLFALPQYATGEETSYSSRDKTDWEKSR